MIKGVVMDQEDNGQLPAWPPLPVELTEKESKKEGEDFEKKYYYLLAEFNNYRKRIDKEKEESNLQGMIRAISSLIPVIESLEMAFEDLSNILPEDRKKGLAMVIASMQKAFSELGIEVINPLNEPYDPMYEEVIMEQPVEDKSKLNKVVAVVRKGYKVNGKMLKAAQVVIGTEKKQ